MVKSAYWGCAIPIRRHSSSEVCFQILLFTGHRLSRLSTMIHGISNKTRKKTNTFPQGIMQPLHSIESRKDLFCARGLHNSALRGGACSPELCKLAEYDKDYLLQMLIGERLTHQPHGGFSASASFLIRSQPIALPFHGNVITCHIDQYYRPEKAACQYIIVLRRRWKRQCLVCTPFPITLPARGQSCRHFSENLAHRPHESYHEI
jgi:hypothetical protein